MASFVCSEDGIGGKRGGIRTRWNSSVIQMGLADVAGVIFCTYACEAGMITLALLM